MFASFKVVLDYEMKTSWKLVKQYNLVHVYNTSYFLHTTVLNLQSI